MTTADNGVELRRLASSANGPGSNPTSPSHQSLPPVRSYANLPQPTGDEESLVVCLITLGVTMSTFAKNTHLTSIDNANPISVSHYLHHCPSSILCLSYSHYQQVLILQIVSSPTPIRNNTHPFHDRSSQHQRACIGRQKRHRSLFSHSHTSFTICCCLLF
jgi:hypothetical protein